MGGLDKGSADMLKAKTIISISNESKTSFMKTTSPQKIPGTRNCDSHDVQRSLKMPHVRPNLTLIFQLDDIDIRSN
ncbi:hypothetical protein QTP88_012917 [Uroleucon formosanum]